MPENLITVADWPESDHTRPCVTGSFFGVAIALAHVSLFAPELAEAVAQGAEAVNRALSPVNRPVQEFDGACNPIPGSERLVNLPPCWVAGHGPEIIFPKGELCVYVATGQVGLRAGRAYRMYSAHEGSSYPVEIAAVDFLRLGDRVYGTNHPSAFVDGPTLDQTRRIVSIATPGAFSRMALESEWRAGLKSLTWRVGVRVTGIATVDVEAATRDEAETLARAKFPARSMTVSCLEDESIYSVTQLSEEPTNA